MTERTCNFDGCGRPMHSRGLCHPHYKQQLRGSSLKPLMQKADKGEPLRWLLNAVRLETDECILWPFGKTHGYGKITIDRRNWPAHRFALELVEPWHPPYGTHALHSCDTPACVNPAHLSWGTHAENVRQMWDRGRGWSQVRTA